jgi:magnesium-transporting ATPase (P-type)
MAEADGAIAPVVAVAASAAAAGEVDTHAPAPAKRTGCCSKEKPDFRDVVILSHEANAAEKFCDNSITTSKYNIFNFLPKSIAEQFKRVANFWLLFMSLVMIIGQYFPALYKSPLNGWSCFGPLCLVIAVTMLKVGLEDIARHVADFRVNNGRSAEVVPAFGAAVVKTKWKDIACGDLVVIHDGDQVPADMVVVGTSQDEGEVHIETSNIDGETNLKLRQAVIAVREWCEADGADAKDAATVAKLASLSGTLHCEVPNPRIESFIGSIRASKEFAAPVSLSNKNVLLRGCTVHQCEWVCGLVVYTGKQTKVMQKSSKTSAVKFSNMEKLVNKCIFVILSTSIALAIVSATLKQISWNALLEHWYLMLNEGALFTSFVYTFLLMLFDSFVCSLLILFFCS